MAIELRPQDRYSIVGKTGSGKTLFTIALVCLLVAAEIERANGWEIWWLDSKRDPDDRKILEAWGFTPIDAPWWSRRTARKLITLDPANGAAEWQAQMWAARAIKRGRVVLVADEYKQVCISTRRAGPGMEDVHLRGRGLKVGLAGQTQEPCEIPRQLLSQATHLFLMNLTYPNDIKYAKTLYAEYEPPNLEFGDPHGLWYAHIDGDARWHYFPHVKAFHDMVTKRAA
jgi:hypothetical protein